MTVPTVAEIVKEIEDSQAAMLPGQKSMEKLTGHYLANLSVAAAIREVYQQKDDDLARINILTATGSDLNALVLPVLINGRLLGAYSTGVVLFESGYPATSDIVIPAGTRVYAILEDATKVFFQTTAAGAILTGQTQANIACRAVTRGLTGNIGPYQVVEIETRITGLTAVSNPLEFSGGTLDETDGELRQRYWDKIQAVGKATALMIQRALLDLVDVTEALIINHGSGDLSVLVNYSGGIADDSQDIISCLRASIGAGNVARGTLGATVDSEAVVILEDDVYGGRVYVRARDHVLTEDTFSFTYHNMAMIENTGTVTIPAGTRRGEMVLATLQLPTDRAKAILSVTPSSNGHNYDILMGMGTTNYLYNLPEQITVSIAAQIKLTDTPEQNLTDNIRTSLNAFLSHFYMGVPLMYSDVIRFMNNMYDTTADENIGRPIKGIKELVSLTVTGGGHSAYRIGDEIPVEEDWQIVSSDDISITVVT